MITANQRDRTPTPPSSFALEPLEGRLLCASAADYLAGVMDQYQASFDVYSDVDAPGNHFVARAALFPSGGIGDVPAMIEDFSAIKHTGLTSISAKFKAKRNNYGGWLFLNGTLNGKQRAPNLNFGSVPDAGVDLTGATTLTFWARGVKGGEKVEFFALGVGRAPDTTPPAPYPDSAPKVSTGTISLSRRWKKFTLSLSGLDLSYVIGGFGWVAKGAENHRGLVNFFLDDIAYDKSRLADPRLLRSFVPRQVNGTFDRLVRNSASTYDNSIALMAFLASGNPARAGLIADALLYAQSHDPLYSDGRLRNSYAAGDLAVPPSWTPRGKSGAVRLPGYYNARRRRFIQDNVQLGSATGTQAWAIIALTAYYQESGSQAYLDAASDIGNWIDAHCKDETIGFTAGFGNISSASRKLRYKSTEENIALAAAFEQLYRLTGLEAWKERKTSALSFVKSMFEPTTRRFLSGTDSKGKKSFDVTPVDAQALGVLLLHEAGTAYDGALAYAQQHLKKGRGFDFNTDRDGIWYEGTAQMALALQETGKAVPSQVLLDFLYSAQSASGAVPAASKDGLTTGFFLKPHLPSVYYRRSHTGSTAWLILAEQHFNPFDYAARQ